MKRTISKGLSQMTDTAITPSAALIAATAGAVISSGPTADHFHLPHPLDRATTTNTLPSEVRSATTATTKATRQPRGEIGEAWPTRARKQTSPTRASRVPTVTLNTALTGGR